MPKLIFQCCCHNSLMKYYKGKGREEERSPGISFCNPLVSFCRPNWEIMSCPAWPLFSLQQLMTFLSLQETHRQQPFLYVFALLQEELLAVAGREQELHVASSWGSLLLVVSCSCVLQPQQSVWLAVKPGGTWEVGTMLSLGNCMRWQRQGAEQTCCEQGLYENLPELMGHLSIHPPALTDWFDGTNHLHLL